MKEIAHETVTLKREFIMAFGFEGATILQNIIYWTKINQSNESEHHYREGRWWVFYSARQLQIQYPFISHNKIRRTLTKFEAEGILVSGNFNKLKYDRTKWYSINEAELESTITQFAESINQNDESTNQNDEPIPNTNLNTNNKEKEEVKNVDFSSPFSGEDFKSLVKVIHVSANGYMIYKKQKILCAHKSAYLALEKGENYISLNERPKLWEQLASHFEDEGVFVARMKKPKKKIDRMDISKDDEKWS